MKKQFSYEQSKPRRLTVEKVLAALEVTATRISRSRAICGQKIAFEKISIAPGPIPIQIYTCIQYKFNYCSVHARKSRPRWTLAISVCLSLSLSLSLCSIVCIYETITLRESMKIIPSMRERLHRREFGPTW